MNQDLKDYFRRTLVLRCGGWGAQILLLCLGTSTFISVLGVIAAMEILYLIGYLFIFGIKRKDGTWIRFNTMDKLIRASEEQTETIEHLKERIKQYDKY